MSLTSLLKDQNSWLSQYLYERLDVESLNRYVSGVNDELQAVKLIGVRGGDVMLAGAAMSNVLAWGMGFFDPWMAEQGAQRIGLRYFTGRILDRGADFPQHRPAYCVVLSLLEKVYRSNGKEVHPILHEIERTGNLHLDGHDSLSKTVADVAALSKHVRNFTVAPFEEGKNHVRFPHSNTLNGADAQLIVGNCLYDTRTSWKTRPFTTNDVFQQAVYTMLSRDTTHNPRGVSWVFTRQQTILTLPTQKLFRTFFDREQERMTFDFLQMLDDERENQEALRSIRLDLILGTSQRILNRLGNRRLGDFIEAGGDEDDFDMQIAPPYDLPTGDD